MEWISVKDFLPGICIDWVIVRTENSDKEEFYFMASYSCNSKVWNYFDDDKGYEKSMKITHWIFPDKITEY